MKLLLSSLIFIFLNVSNCSSDKSFKELKFGSGGGFTGAVTEFRMKENGDVFQYNSVEKEEKLIKSITSEELKTIKEKIKLLPSDALNINRPYNMYYFIQLDTAKTVWGDPSFTAPKELLDLYNYLNALAVKQ
jgi:hypothetical protein